MYIVKDAIKVDVKTDEIFLRKCSMLIVKHVLINKCFFYFNM